MYAEERDKLLQLTGSLSARVSVRFSRKGVIFRPGKAVEGAEGGVATLTLALSQRERVMNTLPLCGRDRERDCYAARPIPKTYTARAEKRPFRQKVFILWMNASKSP